jgi:hypothetical protein
MRYGDNLLADLGVEDKAGFKNYVRMKPADFEVSLQMIAKYQASVYSCFSTF